MNLLDEAARKHIQVDLDTLQKLLGCPVIGAAARSGWGLPQLQKLLEEAVSAPPPPPPATAADGLCPCRQAAALALRAREIAAQAVTIDEEAAHRGYIFSIFVESYQIVHHFIVQFIKRNATFAVITFQTY